MVVLDNPPVAPIGAEPCSPSGDAAPHWRCTLCLNWRPADEMVEINSAILCGSACALRYADLVPPPLGVLWPVGGFLLDALEAWARHVLACAAGTEVPSSVIALRA